jgi:adenylate cyclase
VERPLAADVADYSRLMGGDEFGTLAALKAIRREIVDPAIAEHKGRIVKTTGDTLLVKFASAVEAVTCSMFAQAQMALRNGTPERRANIALPSVLAGRHARTGRAARADSR